MMKKALLISLMMISAASCSWWNKVEEKFRLCPIIDIKENLLFQRTAASSGFRIEIIGVEGYCYVEESSGLNKAVINPVIKITPSANSDETDLHFAFYTETLQGPPQYLGKRTHLTSATIPEGMQEIIFRPNPVTRVVPHELEAAYDLNVGLILSPSEAKNIRKAFHKRSR